MKASVKKRLVMIGIKRRGEKGFKLIQSLSKIESLVIQLSNKQKENLSQKTE